VSDDRQVTSYVITELGGTDQVYPRVTIGALPDDVLLEIFDLYLPLLNIEPSRLTPYLEDAWHTLVHVCRQWRYIVFASPHRLKLQLLCTLERPVQNTLDIWPELPIVIRADCRSARRQTANNIIAPLTRHNRVGKIYMVNIPNLLVKKIRAMTMEDPFLVLTFLLLHSKIEDVPALPDSFLGGSAPQLQTLSLDGIPFPALPNLLLSTHGLVKLSLLNVPLSGYISPEAMFSGLSALTSLEVLRLRFRFLRSRADRENRLVPRLTRVVLPALTSLSFQGDSEYLEDIVAQIDTPRLTRFKISFFNQLIFDIRFFGHLIGRTETFKGPHRAQVAFWERRVEVRLYPRDRDSFHEMSSLTISCWPSDWQLSSVAQVCDSALSPLPTLERLEIYIKRSWKDDVENAQWLELMHPFVSMRDLCLYDESIQHVAPALEQLAGESVTEALPALQNLFLEGPQPSEPVKKAIGKFVAARQLSDHPVSVHHRTDERSTWQQVDSEAGGFLEWEAGDQHAVLAGG
jgi:hypothetical protein